METGPNSVSSISQSETSGARIKGHPSCVCEASHTNIQCWNKKGPCCRRIKTGFVNRRGSQPVLVIQLWNKAGIWCKFRTNNLSSPWSKFIWSQGPAADESTCAHQKCCATGAEVSGESSGWVVVWVAFGRKIQDDPGRFRDLNHQYQGSDLAQYVHQRFPQKWHM